MYVLYFNHPDNMVAIDKNLHRRISGYYSSKPNFTGGKTFRDFLNGKDFEEQYNWGIMVLENAKTEVYNGVIYF